MSNLCVDPHIIISVQSEPRNAAGDSGLSRTEIPIIAAKQTLLDLIHDVKPHGSRLGDFILRFYNLPSPCHHHFLSLHNLPLFIFERMNLLHSISR